MDDSDDDVPIVKMKKVKQGDSSSSEMLKTKEIRRKLQNNETLQTSDKLTIIEILEKKRKIDSSSVPSPPALKTAKKVKQVNKSMQTTGKYLMKTAKINKGKVEYKASSEPIEEMKLEAKSKTPNLEKLKELMNRTFNERRDFILRRTPLLSQVKEKFPVLFLSSTQIRLEVDRLFHSGKASNFMSNITKHCDSVLSLSSASPLKKKINQLIQETDEEDEQRVLKETASLLLLPATLGEKACFVVLADKPTELDTEEFPHIKASCNSLDGVLTHEEGYQVCVEGHDVCEAETFGEAVFCMIACYFIFNICYPKECVATFVLLERVYLEVSETPDIDVPQETKKFIKKLL